MHRMVLCAMSHPSRPPTTKRQAQLQGWRRMAWHGWAVYCGSVLHSASKPDGGWALVHAHEPWPAFRTNGKIEASDGGGSHVMKAPCSSSTCE